MKTYLVTRESGLGIGYDPGYFEVYFHQHDVQGKLTVYGTSNMMVDCSKCR